MLLYFLRPTATETAVQQHLEHIEESRAVEGDGTTILRRQALSATPWLDELIRDIPGSVRLARLIRQAGQTWQVSSAHSRFGWLVTRWRRLAGIAGHSQRLVERDSRNHRGLACRYCISIFARELRFRQMRRTGA